MGEMWRCARWHNSSNACLMQALSQQKLSWRQLPAPNMQCQAFWFPRPQTFLWQFLQWSKFQFLMPTWTPWVAWWKLGQIRQIGRFATRHLPGDQQGSESTSRQGWSFDRWKAQGGQGLGWMSWNDKRWMSWKDLWLVVVDSVLTQPMVGAS